MFLALNYLRKMLKAIRDNKIICEGLIEKKSYPGV